MPLAPEYTVPKMIKDSAHSFAEYPAQQIRHKDGSFSPILYRDFFQNALDFGAALLSFGVERQQPVGPIADNREEWLDTSVGIMSIGAFDVPRGCDATPDNLEKILSITECKIVVTENGTQVKKLVGLKDKLPHLEIIISFTDDVKPEILAELEEKKIQYYPFKDVMGKGKNWRIDNPGKVEEELEKEPICGWNRT